MFVTYSFESSRSLSENDGLYVRSYGLFLEKYLPTLNAALESFDNLFTTVLKWFETANKKSNSVLMNLSATPDLSLPLIVKSRL